MNRRLAGSLADLHFAPTPGARDNLLHEGVAPEQIHVTGNTVVDALLGVVDRVRHDQDLDAQARWLARKPEYHLLGNHLLANGKARVFAGLFFDGPEAARWLRQGERILGTEVPEQVLPDGGHFERSPMYHVIVLEDLLDILNLYRAAGRPVPDEWTDAARRMAAWLPVMCHPDGEIGFFNDAAFGIAPNPERLYAFAERLGVSVQASGKPVTALADSGYIRLETGEAVCLAGVAPVGPDYLPGHAHADTLSSEVSLFGRRVFVNSGTSVYGCGRERIRQRGTAAHNTVQVEGEDSSEVWSGFRTARRAYPDAVDYGIQGTSRWLTGAHDGYKRLARGQVHRRSWWLQSSNMTITDELGAGFTQASARFHLYPGLDLLEIDRDLARIRTASGHTITMQVRSGAIRTEPSTYHPRFGVSQPNQCLVVDFHGQEAEYRISW